MDPPPPPAQWMLNKRVNLGHIQKKKMVVMQDKNVFSYIFSPKKKTKK